MWSSDARSVRKSRLPKDWNTRRKFVLSRDDYRCQIEDDGCLGEATDADHIVAGDDHSYENLQAACARCHGKKSSREGHAVQRRMRAARKRPAPGRPGR